MSSLANFIMRGRWQAALVMTLTALLSLTGILAPLSLISGAALALVTLRLGAVQGLAVIGYGALALAVVSVAVFTDITLAWLVLLTYWLPALVLAEVLRRASLSLTVSLGAVVTLVYVVLVYLIVGDPAPDWAERLQQVMTLLMGQGQPLTADIQEVITGLSTMMTGMQAASELGYTIMVVFIARAWQAKLYNPGGFRKEFHSFRMQPWFVWPTLLVMVTLTLTHYMDAALLGQLALELGIILLALYLLQGLAVAHAVVAARQASVVWLVLLYVALILPQVVILMAMMGFGDSWLNFRGRLVQTKVD